MEPTSHITFKTLAVVAVLLAALGALAGSLVASAQKGASEAHTFVGTMPEAGATEGNVTDLSH